MADVSAEDFFRISRTLVSAEARGFGTVYYYTPPTVAERDASQKHYRMNPDTGEVSTSLEGMVDGIIARARTADGRPMFRAIHRRRMLEEMTADTLQALWAALSDDTVSESELAKAAEKK